MFEHVSCHYLPCWPFVLLSLAIINQYVCHVEPFLGILCHFSALTINLLLGGRLRPRLHPAPTWSSLCPGHQPPAPWRPGVHGLPKRLTHMVDDGAWVTMIQAAAQGLTWNKPSWAESHCRGAGVPPDVFIQVAGTSIFMHKKVDELDLFLGLPLLIVN